ncbi:MAG: carboxylating nicotinate-nucleotide diphosphorylase [Candidatus Bathyarchaeia archaeon]|jgi:nicotinate-nucleotide pyrophosphorylase (carboxylating)
MFLPDKILEDKLLMMLAEDLGQGDITTGLINPPGTMAEAEIVAKDSGIAAGIKEAEILMKSLGLKVETLVQDGERIRPGRRLIKLSGDAGTILSVERTVLNILSRMSGIATSTRNVIEKLQKAKLKVTVASTRKTAPGLMYFDKKAVLIGGGDTHRLHLDDMILIKDNHIALAGSIGKAIGKARQKASFSKKIEIEVANAEDALKAAKGGADIIMLDNFSPDQARKACALLRKAEGQKRILIEASGGITAESVMRYASTGVDVVSLGEITESAKALNISLEITKISKQ